MHDRQPVALVTGSASGIGAGIARRLAADGMTVVVHSRTSRDAGLKLAAEIGGSYQQADLADEPQCQELITRVLNQHEHLDVLVNNAGISWPIARDDLGDVTASVWRQLLDVNLIALVSDLRRAHSRVASQRRATSPCAAWNWRTVGNPGGAGWSERSVK